MSALIFALALLSFTPPARAETADRFSCWERSSDEEVRRCLNDYAKEQLREGSAAEAHFRERFSRLLAKYGLTSQQVKFRPLAESFSIFVEDKSQLQSASKKDSCFKFDSVLPSGKRRKVESLKSQIDEAALFLAELHASSWGHQVSLLFPIKEVSICSKALTGNRRVLFEQRSLLLGFHKKPMPAGEILALWNSGNPIRNTELSWFSKLPLLGKLRSLRQKWTKDYEGLIRDQMADQWLVLNPTGSLRATALYTLGEAIFKVHEGLSDQSENEADLQTMFARLQDVVKGPGFSTRDQERIAQLKDRPGDIQGLYALWQQKIFSPQNILTVIENAIGDQARHDSKIHLALRKINAGVAVVNDKTIVVRLEQLMQSSIPVSLFEGEGGGQNTIEVTRSETRERKGETETKATTFKVDKVDLKDLTLNADQVNGGVVVDLIDDVLVSVQLPQISPATYRRVCLYQAMQEYIEGGAAIGPLR